MFAFLSSSKLTENLNELHIIARTTGTLQKLLSTNMNLLMMYMYICTMHLISYRYAISLYSKLKKQLHAYLYFASKLMIFNNIVYFKQGYFIMHSAYNNHL